MTTDFEGYSTRVEDVVIQPDGRIVAVGTREVTNATGQVVRHDFAVARYSPDGVLDPTFSGDGKKTETWGDDASAYAVALQSEDGKIVVVGSHQVASTGNSNFAMARYTTKGELDPDFDGDGKQVTDFGGNELASDVAIHTDGKIVVVGSTLYHG